MRSNEFHGKGSIRYNGSERICSRLGDRTFSLDCSASLTPQTQQRLGTRIMHVDQNFRAELLELVEAGDVPVEFPNVLNLITLLPAGSNANSHSHSNPNTGIFYYHTNHLGSTAFVTDGNATVTQGFLYAPFGEIISEYQGIAPSSALPKYAFNAKELDEETGMYYYEARYMAPPTFISRDPLFEKYFWMSPYAYCANNPVKYVDPSGEWPFWFDLKNRQSGWGHQAPQRFLGYSRFYDEHMNTLFDIQGTEFIMNGVTLRLWKGDYGKLRDLLPNNISGNVGGAGGEIGLYNSNKSVNIGNEKFDAAMTKSDLKELGLVSTDLKVYNKQTGDLVASRNEESSFWTTSFSWDKKGKGEELYSVNTFIFKDNEHASRFFNELKSSINEAKSYEHNYSESIKIQQKNKNVIIIWGE